MEQKTEALYLINGDRFLHLRENGAGVGFATYDCANGAPLESGQISKQNLPPDGRNAIPAARNWYLFEPVSYTHLRAHETEADLVCRLLLEKKKN